MVIILVYLRLILRLSNNIKNEFCRVEMGEQRGMRWDEDLNGDPHLEYEEKLSKKLTFIILYKYHKNNL